MKRVAEYKDWVKIVKAGETISLVMSTEHPHSGSVSIARLVL